MTTRADAAEARWAALRAEIESRRNAAHRHGDDCAEEGKDELASRSYGAVDALDEVLKLMDHWSAR